MVKDKKNKDSDLFRHMAKSKPVGQKDRISVTALFLSLWAVCVLCVFVTSKILLPNISRGGLPQWAQGVEGKCREERSDWHADSDIYAEESFAYIILDDNHKPIVDLAMESGAPKTAASAPDVNDGDLAEQDANRTESAGEGKAASYFNRLHAIDVIGDASRNHFSPFDAKSGKDGRHQGKYVVYIAADDRIVKKGDLLYSTEITEEGDSRHFTPELYTLLAYEQYLDKIECATANMRKLLSTCIIIAVILLAFGYCLYSMRADLFDSIKELLLCGTCLFIHILALLLALLVFPKFGGGSSFSLFALMPLGLGAALSSNLLGRRVGTYTALLLSVLTPLLLGCEFKFHLLIQAFISSVVAILMFHDVQKRSQYLLGGIAITVNVILFTLFYGYLRELPWLWESFNPFWSNILGLSVINALAIIILVLLLTPVLERLFGVTTFVTFKENYSLEHKLLERLRNEAPGTYEHCVTVAQIASDAARVIGVNEQMTKSCAYFHDIGKLKDPKMFAENLLDGEENQHDNLSTLESCAILREHVRYGLELARKNHLPVVIQEAIEQHHGNGLMTGFYAKAMRQAEEEGKQPPDKSEYSYTGRRPQRPEVVLVFLADFCEAAIRASVKHWEKSLYSLIRSKIEELVDAKMAEHQLDSALLTLSDLHKVIDRMVETFCTIYHVRPEYADNKTVIHAETFAVNHAQPQQEDSGNADEPSERQPAGEAAPQGADETRGS